MRRSGDYGFVREGTFLLSGVDPDGEGDHLDWEMGVCGSMQEVDQNGLPAIYVGVLSRLLVWYLWWWRRDNS